MKVAVLIVPMLMLVFLSGCTEQSRMTGPVTTVFDSIVPGIISPLATEKFEQMVVAYDGKEFFVSGTVDYALSLNGASYALTTILNADINQQGTANTWTIASGKGFHSTFNDEGSDVVSVNNDFGCFARKFPLYRLVLDYSVNINGLKITDMRIVSATTAEAQ